MPVFVIDNPIPLQEADGMWRDLRPNYEPIDLPTNLRFFTIPGKEEHGPQPYIMWSNGRRMRVRCEMIVLDSQGRMLIKPNPTFKRLGETYQYDCPGGGINKGESVEEAAERECKEEARLTVRDIKFTGIHYTYEVPNESKDAWGVWGHISFVCVAMKGEPYTGYIAPIDREDSFVKKMQWVYPNEIDIIPAHEEAIRWYKQYCSTPIQEASIPTDEYQVNRFISGQDVYVNYDKWTSGKINKLFIIGLSGSGKSTLGNRLAEQFNCDVVHTDRFRGNVHYSDEDLYKIDPVVYRYFDTVWKGGLKRRFDVKTMPKDQRTLEFKKFIYWVLEQNDTIIIEGAVEKLLINDPKLQEYPIVFKGTSMAKSMIRMVRRELFEKPTFEGAPISWILKFITRYADMRDLNNQARDSVMQHGPSYTKINESVLLEANAEFQPMSTAPQPGRVYDPQLGIWIDPKTKDQDKYCGWFVAEEREWLKKVKFVSDPNVRGGKPQPVIYDEDGNTFRPRCEVIVLDGYKVLIDPKKNRGNFHPPYSLPGGGVDGKESIADCARRECEEEARVIPKGCVYTGIAWKLEFADPVFNKGSISFICIAERGKDYKGYVKVEDRDPFVDRAKWVDYRKFKLGEPHQKAIEIFRKMQFKEEWISALNMEFLNEEYEVKA